jgi:hypothetical protein
VHGGRPGAPPTDEGRCRQPRQDRIMTS